MRDFFIESIEAEHQINSAVKQFKKQDVDADELFRSLDRYDAGYISKQQISRLLENFNYQPTERELQMIMSRLDLDNDGRVNLKEFGHFIGQ